MKFLKNPLPLLIIGGICAGFVNGLLGAGGGIIVVYLLNSLLGRDTDSRDVFANALCVMLPLSVLSCSIYFARGGISIEGLELIIIPAIAGGLVGAYLLSKIKPSALKTLFAALVAVSGIILILK